MLVELIPCVQQSSFGVHLPLLGSISILKCFQLCLVVDLHFRLGLLPNYDEPQSFDHVASRGYHKIIWVLLVLKSCLATAHGFEGFIRSSNIALYFSLDVCNSFFDFATFF